MKWLFLLTLFFSGNVLAEEAKAKDDGLEPVVEPIMFDKIKDVIKKDRLGDEVVKKKYA